MKFSYRVSVKKGPSVEIPDLCCTESVDAAVAVVRALLGAEDSQITEVILAVGRTLTREVNV